MKRCIVSADDFGLSAAVDDGIVALVEAGVVTAASCLVRAPRWPSVAQRLARAAHGRADIGVHIDLTEFDRIASNHAALVLACGVHGVDVARLRAVVTTQLDHFEGVLGRGPDYVDGHRHVHQLPLVRDVLVDLLAHRYAAPRPWVRISRSGPGAGWKAGLIDALGAEALAAGCARAGLAHSARLHGIYDFTGDVPMHRRRLATWLAAAGEGDALMCHPALRRDPDDPIGLARFTEYDVLSSEWWADCLAAHRLQPCRGSDCLHP